MKVRMGNCLLGMLMFAWYMPRGRPVLLWPWGQFVPHCMWYYQGWYYHFPAARGSEYARPLLYFWFPGYYVKQPRLDTRRDEREPAQIRPWM